MSDEAKAQELISIFVCEKDADIENFLENKAIQFEKLGKSRTFFIYDEDEDEFQILAYFSLAIQVLKIKKRNKSNYICRVTSPSLVWWALFFIYGGIGTRHQVTKKVRYQTPS